MTLIAMCVAQGMILLDNTIVNVALPSIQRELDVDPGNLIWVVNAYVLALASLIMVGGTLGDRYGRKRVFLIGLAIFTAMSAACALSPNESALIAARAAQGVGAALVAPLSLSILADAYPPERRTTAIGIWAAAAGLGFGAGPVVGGILVELFSWSAVFWVNVPVGIIGLVLVITGVRESRNPNARKLDLPGAVLVAAGLCVLTFAIVESEHIGWTSPTMIALLAAAAVLLGSFLVVESRAREPMVPLGLFRDSRFTVSCGVYAIMYLALASTFFFVTLFFQNVEGWSALEVGLSWLIMNTPFLVTSTLAGKLSGWIGTATCWLGVLLGGFGVLALAFLTPGAGLLAASPGYVLIGAGYGMAVPTISSVAVSALPVEHSGLASGVLNSARQVGTAIGLAALGSVGLAVTRSSWAAQSAQLPTSAQAGAPDIVQDVSGGQGSVVAQQLGAAAKPLVDSAFVDGLHVALLIGGGLMLVAAAFAFTVLRQPAVTAPTRAGVRLFPAAPPTRPQAESRTVLSARPAILIVHRRWRDHLTER
ncbi:MAG TPA: MFS transporter [Propionibacteriaceae bacterium]|nr:MFS transporter [Propionibacteriaceae bacterium]